MTGSGRPSNRGLALRLLAMAAGSFAFGYALVPLYGVFCEVTGIGSRDGLSERAAAVQSGPDLARSVTVEFVASAPGTGQWEFRPNTQSLQVHPGRLYEATFHAHNLAGRPLTGQAVPSIAPAQATRHFRKTECFCFTPQHFAAGESRDLMVRFYVDRDLPRSVDRLTLSYALFEAPGLAQAPAGPGR